ncbi:MAG: bifunctional oligoribonuclease/PAP phosphatase NrnA [Spirochaetales bacterium]|nr:bifunctional oligoribonuclease/PAP phosphatase NrnA [Spirochaetales bacterium]
MNKTPQKIINFINKYETFVVIGHERPDGDSRAAQKGLCHLLKKLNKECAAAYYIPDDAEIPENPEDPKYKRFIENNTAEYYISQGHPVILVDCNELSRIGKFKDLIKNNPIGIVDHHVTEKVEAEASYINSEYPAAALLIKNLFDEFKINPEIEIAKELFYGFCTDTGFFQFLRENQGDYIHDAADLVNSGASPKEAYKDIYGGKSLESRRYIARIISEMEVFNDEKLIVITEEKEDSKLKDNSSSEIYNLLFNAKNTEVIVFIKYTEDDRLAISLRSKDRINVGAIARIFDGGGHDLAAGFKTDLDYSEVKAELIKILNEKLVVLQNT